MSDQKMLVLVADDEALVRATLCRKLEDAGFATAQAANGFQALEIVGRLDVAVVVIDIVMPEKEGLSTIGQIKEDKPGLPILAISGGGTGDAQDYLRFAKELGADEIMAKPFFGDEFVNCVKRLASGRRPD